MDPLFTMCIATNNVLPALRLALESFRYYHPDLPYLLFAAEDNSKDGTLEYLIERANLLQHVSDVSANKCWDDLCMLVRTPYTIIIHDDVEFMDKVVLDQNETILNTFGFISYPTIPAPPVRLTWESNPNPEGNTPERFHVGMFEWVPRIESCFSIIKTEILQKVLAHISWGDYIGLHSKEYFDSGAMLYKVFIALEYPGVFVNDWQEKIIHYGGLATYQRVIRENLNADTGWLAAKKERWETTIQRLSLLEGKMK